MTLEDFLRDARLGIDLVRAIVSAVADGKNLKELRVADILPHETQLDIAKRVADEKARLKFGEIETP